MGKGSGQSGVGGGKGQWVRVVDSEGLGEVRGSG